VLVGPRAFALLAVNIPALTATLPVKLVLLPDKVSVAAPIFVSVLVPLTAPLKVKLPPTILIVESLPSVMLPLMEEAASFSSIAPSVPEMPFPFIVKSSLPIATFCSVNVPPLTMLVPLPAPVAPKALLFVTIRFEFALTVVVPE